MMERQDVPTLGRVLQYLRDIGFDSVTAPPGVLVYAHPASGAEFLFRDRDPATPARPNELANLHAQLTLRGLVTNADFERFLTGNTQHSTT
ncbi:MAG TPA: hypothetical protein VM529_23890, partial [Gemmata sp.]|nr:hypothetical protein [Gemmata sp.]